MYTTWFVATGGAAVSMLLQRKRGVIPDRNFGAKIWPYQVFDRLLLQRRNALDSLHDNIFEPVAHVVSHDAMVAYTPDATLLNVRL